MCSGTCTAEKKVLVVAVLVLSFFTLFQKQARVLTFEKEEGEEDVGAKFDAFTTPSLSSKKRKLFSNNPQANQVNILNRCSH
jgi:hypothetical protein